MLRMMKHALNDKARSQFVQEWTLRGLADPSRPEEVIERRPGYSGDFGDRALRAPELEESANLVLVAAEV